MRFVVRIHQGGWSFEELLAVWQEADSLGYDGASLFDLLGADGPECLTALTALIARTERIVGVPLVLAAPYRHPAVVARMAATLDALSGGRLILGLGSGGSQEDAKTHGVPWSAGSARLRALEDGVVAMRLLWERGGSFESETVTPTGAIGLARAARSGGPPVLIGGHGRGLIGVAARQADLCNIGFDLSPEEWRRWRGLLDSEGQEAGRPPGSVGLTHNATVLIGETPADVEARVRAWAAERRLDQEEARARLATTLCGTPQELITRLQELGAVGVVWTFLLFPELPDRTGMRIFAERVMPALK